MKREARVALAACHKATLSAAGVRALIAGLPGFADVPAEADAPTVPVWPAPRGGLQVPDMTALGRQAAGPGVGEASEAPCMRQVAACAAAQPW